MLFDNYVNILPVSIPKLLRVYLQLTAHFHQNAVFLLYANRPINKANLFREMKVNKTNRVTQIDNCKAKH